MNASYEWLKEFTHFDLTPRQLRDLITASVATVDDLVPLRSDLAQIVVGRVIHKEPHPDSDHLNLTKVDAGTGELFDVVCGASNVVVGTLYPFAPVGATLPGGLTIEKRKIRGARSNGMLCSARELGLGDEHEGILALDIDVPPGTPLLNALPLGDTQLVIDVLANRPDLLSHEGVAREIAAATGTPLMRPTVPNGVPVSMPFAIATGEGSTGGVRVCVGDEAECPLYVAVVIHGVEVGPSPEWLVQRLQGSGVRSISNVVDATNYMLHGFGQPMHAFDVKKLEGQAIVVRKATPGEKLTTLDGVARTLTDSMLVIADGKRAQAVAGVIGGADSEVDDTTTDILLEVAVFDPQSVRTTRRKLGVSTDASYRFERAIDRHAVEDLARYAAELIVSVAGGKVDGAPLIVGGVGNLPEAVDLRVSRVAQLLGDPVSSERCESLLGSIEFGVEQISDDVLRVTPPTWRSDVLREVDLIEEIARLHGYDTFSNDLRPARSSAVPESAAYTISNRVVHALVAAGFYEVRPLPFVADAGEYGVRITNPLAEDEAMLRSSVLSTLAHRVEYNFAHMARTIRLFEVGVGFSQNGQLVDGALPNERTYASVVIAGDRYPAHFTNAKPPHADIWDARYVAEAIGRAAYGDGVLQFAANVDGSGWDISVDGTQVGVVAPMELDVPVWAPPVFGIEIEITPAFERARSASTYRPLPTTPATEFDLALLVPDDMPAAQVEQVIAETAGELLESLAPFDEFRGKGVEPGFRSIAWRLTLRHPERTLREKEIEGRRAKILFTLQQTLGVRPRAS